MVGLVGNDVANWEAAVPIDGIKAKVADQVDHGVADWFVIQVADDLRVPPAVQRGGGCVGEGEGQDWKAKGDDGPL